MSMLPASARRSLSHRQYFALEQEQDRRYEYLAGEVFAMAGGSESHALICTNTATALSIAMRDRPCRVYGSDMKLRIATVDKFCYSDVQVICHPERNPRFSAGPALVVEVLSRSTESYDRGLKFEHYRLIPELAYYLLLDQERPHAELFERHDANRWVLSEVGNLEGRIELPQWQIALAMAELYRDVELGPEPLPEEI